MNSDPTILSGFDMGGDIKGQLYNAMSKLFLSFILYDEVIMTDRDFKTLVTHIGLENCFTLLESKKLKLVHDEVALAMEFLNPSGSRLKLTNRIKSLPVIDYFDRSFDKYSNKKSLHPKFIQYIDNALIIKTNSRTNENENIFDCAYNELIKEVNSPEISKNFLSGVENISDMDPYQSTKASRLFNTLKGFSFQDKCGAEVILQDAFSKEYLNSKLTFLLRDEPTDKVDFFSQIIDLKGMPDIYHLLKNKVINIHDVVRFSTTHESNYFRAWFTDKDTSKEDVYLKLMNNKKESVVGKGVRWLYPNIVGLVNPVLGGIASGVDSFIVDKIIKGWSPNIYLDDFLKSNIDNLINKNNKLVKKREIINRFGSVLPNAPCPCQSGLKFKKCHGY